MMNDDRDRIRSRLDIVDVVGKRVPLKKAGKEWVALCPFHDDKNPSMHVVPKLGRYKCFACGASGDIFKFVMDFHKVDFPESLQLLAEEAGIQLTQRSGKPADGTVPRKIRLEAMQFAQDFFVETLAKSEKAVSYCENRGLDEKTRLDWGLGYSPDMGEALAIALKKKGYSLADCRELFLIDLDGGGGFYDRFRGRLMFPIQDAMGNIVAFGGRILGTGNPKYINSGDTPLYSKRHLLYGLNRAKDAMAKTNRAVLVEGYLDVIACHRAGVQTAIASLGTSLSEEHAKLLARHVKEVVILYDADEAGRKAAERAEQLLKVEGLNVRVALMPDGEDPDTLLRTVGPAGVIRAVEQSLSPIEYRLGKLKSEKSPQDPEFWKEAAATLAAADTDLEIEQHLSELAALYPFSTDRSAAITAIKADVMSARKKAQPGHDDAGSGDFAADPARFTREYKRLRGRLAPGASGFWKEYFTIAGYAKNLDEVEPTIRDLAEFFPGDGDIASKHSSLQKQVVRSMRRTKFPPKTIEPRSRMKAKGPKADLDVLEVAVLVALLDLSLQGVAHKILTEKDIFVTQLGIRLSRTLTEANLLGKEPEEWISDLDPETAEVLTELSMKQLVPITEEALNDAIAELRKKRDLRHLGALRGSGTDDSKLRELSDGLGAIKGAM